MTKYSNPPRSLTFDDVASETCCWIVTRYPSTSRLSCSYWSRRARRLVSDALSCCSRFMHSLTMVWWLFSEASMRLCNQQTNHVKNMDTKKTWTRVQILCLTCQKIRCFTDWLLSQLFSRILNKLNLKHQKQTRINKLTDTVTQKEHKKKLLTAPPSQDVKKCKFSQRLSMTAWHYLILFFVFFESFLCLKQRFFLCHQCLDLLLQTNDVRIAVIKSLLHRLFLLSIRSKPTTSRNSFCCMTRHIKRIRMWQSRAEWRLSSKCSLKQSISHKF